MKRSILARASCASLLVAALATPMAVSDDETGTENPWSLSLMLGWKDFEGDEAVKDSSFLSIDVGYDYSRRWTFEGVLTSWPRLSGQSVVNYPDNPKWPLGEVNRLEQINRDRGHEGVTSTTAWGLSLEALYHITRWKRYDPYLVVGAGWVNYGDYVMDNSDDKSEFTLNYGVGMLYHINDEWAVRGDARAFVTGVGRTEANSLVNVGVVWTIGAHVPADYSLKGRLDSDGDGLFDDEEINICHTDPHNPDTDGDGLSDYQEVKVYHTDPLNPDTDMDGLKDGEEVYKYKTNPLNPDTDGGGVSDGHEVLEDGTDPLNPLDDLMLVRLNIEFDTDRAVIKPPYFPDLDRIGKVMSRHPNSTAKIGGHADKRKTSAEQYNVELSGKRAKSVLQYLVEKWKIGANRLTSKGYGFSTPIAKNDPVNGNEKNRRVDVYIKGVRGADASTAEPEPAPGKAGTK